MRLLILAAVAALTSFSGAPAQVASPANCAAQAPHSLSLSFADNQAALTPQARAMLTQAAQIARACPTWTAVVTVYPGDSGLAAGDQGVANRRLGVIVSVLAKLDVPSARLRLITAAAPAGPAPGPAAPSVTGAVIEFAAQGLPQIARTFRREILPGGAPPTRAESLVGALPKGPLMVTNSGAATAGAPPPNAGPAPITPIPSPTTGPPPPAPKLTVTYNAPDSIPLGQDSNYRLIIESANPAGTADFTGAPGPLASHQIPTLTWARAVMAGPQDVVTVQPLSAPCQQVSSVGNPTWTWAVTPKTNKPFFLTVDIYQVADCNAAGVQDIREDTFSIKVTESFWSGLLYEWPAWKSALAWLLATITAVGGAFGAWTWLKSNKSASTSP
jgi:hypothetical protein